MDESASVPRTNNFEALRSRIEYLEYLTSSTKNDEKALNDQVDELQKAVDTLFEKHEPVSNLNSRLYELNLWEQLGDLQVLNKVTQSTGAEGQYTPEDLEAHKTISGTSPESSDEIAKKSGLSTDEKRQVIETQAGVLDKILSMCDAVRAFPDPQVSAQLATLSKDANYYSNEVKLISQRVNELNVRSAQMEMQYLKEIVVRSNEMWVQLDGMLTKLEKNVSSLKKRSESNDATN